MRIGRIECFVQGFWSKRLWLRLVERPKNRAGVVRKWFVSFDIIMYHQRLVAEANESFAQAHGGSAWRKLDRT